MQLGCFSTPNDIPYDADYRSEYQQLRKDPAAVFVTGGCLYKGIPNVSKQYTTPIRTHDGNVLYYAKNIFWIAGYSMEPVPEGGFRRYPVDYTIRKSLTDARHAIAGTRPKVALILKDVINARTGARHFEIYARETDWWNELKTDEMSWTPEADIFDVIAKAAWKSRWIVETVMDWSDRELPNSYQKFLSSLTETIKKEHPAGMFDVRADGENLTSTWLFKARDGSLTDTLYLQKE